MTTWLLTGGAGYIGAHVARDLLASGRQVVVLDDLSAGHRDRVPADAAFVEASVLDTDAVRAALTSYNVTGVIHLAAKKAVGESVEKPLLYFRENVGGMTSLLQAMADAGTRCLVYSSSAAVYGEPPWSPISEDTPCAPLSPYGQTKLIGEWMVRDEAAARPLSWVALRSPMLYRPPGHSLKSIDPLRTSPEILPGLLAYVPCVLKLPPQVGVLGGLWLSALAAVP